MSLHEGEWLGDNGELIYVILNSLGVLWMLITGFQMFSKSISFTKKVTKGESKGSDIELVGQKRLKWPMRNKRRD